MPCGHTLIKTWPPLFQLDRDRGCENVISAPGTLSNVVNLNFNQPEGLLSPLVLTWIELQDECLVPAESVFTCSGICVCVFVGLHKDTV